MKSSQEFHIAGWNLRGEGRFCLPIRLTDGQQYHPKPKPDPTAFFADLNNIDAATNGTVAPDAAQHPWCHINQ
jgi:hypothetical protein